MSDPIDVVRRFCAALSGRDTEAVRPLLTDDAVYQNVGMAANVGVDAVVADLTNQYSMFPEEYRFDIKHVAVNGNVVLTERIDHLAGPAMKLVLPVMGTFVVDGGRISRWTDYFDTGLVAKMMTGEDYSALVPQTY